VTPDRSVLSLTRRPVRGTIELPRRVPCRFCPEKFRNFDDLRFHAQAAHNKTFRVVNRGLAATDAKLRSLETLAAEGMRGYNASAPPPGKQSGIGIKPDPNRLEELVDPLSFEVA
jgi:hypothetical protein